MVITPIVTKPFSRIAMDVVGPIDPSKRNNRFILSVVIMCSRYPHAVPLKSIETKVIVQELMKCFSNIGLCNYLCPDLGTNFTSKLMKEFCMAMGITQLHSTAYRPQTNGCVEKWNGCLKSMLQTGLVGKDKSNWDLLLPSILLLIGVLPIESQVFRRLRWFMGFQLKYR